ncbi:MULTISPECIES: hypothetical protein [unclassified Streptomyces]|uniref:hypothetical protein n=1 Tax=unclassified Streptomyces TaxID=2593676 RepID=UPI001F0F4CAD|nr:MULTISPECIES: hypothetical protein [unclassified Streptomyces]
MESKGEPRLPELRQPPAVAVSAAKIGGKKKPDAASVSVTDRKRGVHWPSAGSAEIRLSDGGGRAGDLPVSLRPAAATVATRAGGDQPFRVGQSHPPQSLRVSVADRNATRKAGVDGLLITLGSTDGSPVSGSVDVKVDYNAFRHAYGGDYAARLRLVELPACRPAPSRAGRPAPPG